MVEEQVSTTAIATISVSRKHPIPVAKQPQRTCVGCRAKDHRSSLLRIVVSVDGTALVLDARKSMPGRGAWLHPRVDCLETAMKRRAWGRALKLRSSVRTDELQDVLAEQVSAVSSTGDNIEEPRGAVSHDHDRKRV